MMQTTRLKRKGVKNVIINDIEYFEVQDIKDNHPDLKVDVNKIVYVNEVALIKAEDIHSITEFDKAIKQIFPKKG